MGVQVDQECNAICRPDTDIATADSPARVLVIHTEEELMVAREARRVKKTFIDRSKKAMVVVDR